MWYYPKDIANILLLKTLKQCHHVTHDSRDRDGVFKVHTKIGIVECIPYDSGLHYLGVKGNEDVSVAIVMMLRENFEGYTMKQVEGAIKASNAWTSLKKCL